MTQNKFKKIFVGGLPPQTSESDMREYFSKYGEVCDVVAMRDKTGNKSRGFGFVVFKEADSVDKCQAERPHYLLGKIVDTKRAMPKEESINPDIHCNSKRIFIGGIRKFFTEDDLRNYFGNFGQIIDCTIKRDNVSGVSRGFAFITFTDRDIVDKVILCKPHSIRSCVVDVKKALSPEELRQLDEHQCHNNSDNYEVMDYQRMQIKCDQDDDKMNEPNGMMKSKKTFSKRNQSYPLSAIPTSPEYLLASPTLSSTVSYHPHIQHHHHQHQHHEDGGVPSGVNGSIANAGPGAYVMLSPEALSNAYAAAMQSAGYDSHQLHHQTTPTSPVAATSAQQPNSAPLIWMSVQQCPNGLILTPVATHDIYTNGTPPPPNVGPNPSYFFPPSYWYPQQHHHAHHDQHQHVNDNNSNINGNANVNSSNTNATTPNSHDEQNDQIIVNGDNTDNKTDNLSNMVSDLNLSDINNDNKSNNNDNIEAKKTKMNHSPNASVSTSASSCLEDGEEERDEEVNEEDEQDNREVDGSNTTLNKNKITITPDKVIVNSTVVSETA